MEYRIMPPGIVLPGKTLRDYEEYHKGTLESQTIQKVLRQITYKRDSGKISSETLEDSTRFEIEPLGNCTVYTLHLKENDESVARIRVEDKSNESVKLLVINLAWEWEATPFIYNLLLDLQSHFDAKYMLDNKAKAQLLSIAPGSSERGELARGHPKEEIYDVVYKELYNAKTYKTQRAAFEALVLPTLSPKLSKTDIDSHFNAFKQAMKRRRKK